MMLSADKIAETIVVILAGNDLATEETPLGYVILEA
jgi:hypothetical protein